MSEFTLDIQLTELGFSNWNFPLCETPSVKDPFPPVDCGKDDEYTVSGSSVVKNILLDHQYCTPFEQDSPRDAETSPSGSIISTNKKEAVDSGRIENITDGEKHRSDDEEHRSDDEEQSEQEESQEKCSVLSAEDASLLIDEVVSGEERTDEDVELVLSDEEVDDDEEGDVEEEDDAEEVEVKEEGEDEVSWSETNESEENKENRCHVCDLTFSSLFLLREHLNMHTGVRPYRCDECGKQFCQLVNYRTHLRSHSHKASIHCRVCSTVFETEEQLQQHLDTNHFEKEFYQCDFCKQIFTDLDVCKGHVEAHRQEAKRHLCLKCGSSFRLRNSLLRHLEWHSRGIFSCPECERTFSSKASLSRHSFFHLGVLPYTCVSCKRHFRLPSLYHNHDCKPENIQCMACLVFFESQEDFHQHKKDTGCWGHQGTLLTKRDEIRCMECGQVFPSIEELKKHGATHQRVLKCSECGMGFRSSLMLMSHMGGHAAQRPCLCQECGLGFPHQQGYDSHLKTCGVVTPPVAAVKKPRPKATPPPQTIKPIAHNIVLQTIAPAPNSATFSGNLKELQLIPVGEQNKSNDGTWKPPPLVMLVPVSTGSPAKNFLPAPLVLEKPLPASRVISVVPPRTIIIKETEKETDGPTNTLISVERHDGTSKKMGTISKDQGSVQGFTTENLKAVEKAADSPGANQQMRAVLQVKEQTVQSHVEHNALGEEEMGPVSSSDAASLNATCSATPLTLYVEDKDDDNIEKASSDLNDLDTPSVIPPAEVRVPSKRRSESQAVDAQCSKAQRLFTEEKSSGSMSAGSQVEFASTGEKSGNTQQGQNESGFDVEVEINEDVDSSSVEMEIGDEDSGVDMLESELHECVTCGQVLPEKEMVQHYMKHAAVADSPEHSPECLSPAAEQPPPCSPSRKRLRSGKVL